MIRLDRLVVSLSMGSRADYATIYPGLLYICQRKGIRINNFTCLALPLAGRAGGPWVSGSFSYGLPSIKTLTFSQNNTECFSRLKNSPPPSAKFLSSGPFLASPKRCIFEQIHHLLLRTFIKLTTCRRWRKLCAKVPVLVARGAAFRCGW